MVIEDRVDVVEIDELLDLDRARSLGRDRLQLEVETITVVPSSVS